MLEDTVPTKPIRPDDGQPAAAGGGQPATPGGGGPAAAGDGLEQALNSLSRLPALDPEHPQTSRIAYQASRQVLAEEPFLAYQGENDQLYWVWSRLGQSLLLPKNRRPARPFPEPEPGRLDAAHRTLALALLGLLLGGLGAFLLAPLAVWRSAGLLLDQSADQPDRVRAGMVVLLATLLWLAAAGLAFLFLLHLIG